MYCKDDIHRAQKWQKKKKKKDKSERETKRLGCERGRSEKERKREIGNRSGGVEAER